MPEGKRLKIVAFTGAGISAESGISVFRSTDVNSKGQALWENHPVDEVANIKAWKGDNKARMLEFYNERRRGAAQAEPNDAHRAIAMLADHHDLTIVTQNIDDLHERAGSTDVIHLHGSLFHARPENDEDVILPWDGDINIGDEHEGVQLRPHIVWFGEGLFGWMTAVDKAMDSDLLIVVGTSLNVYPAASLPRIVDGDIIVVDPNPPTIYGAAGDRAEYIRQPASTGMIEVLRRLELAP